VPRRYGAGAAAGDGAAGAGAQAQVAGRLRQSRGCQLAARPAAQGGCQSILLNLSQVAKGRHAHEDHGANVPVAQYMAIVGHHIPEPPTVWGLSVTMHEPSALHVASMSGSAAGSSSRECCFPSPPYVAFICKASNLDTFSPKLFHTGYCPGVFVLQYLALEHTNVISARNKTILCADSYRHISNSSPSAFPTNTANACIAVPQLCVS
jgi:hypothetical protein